MAIGFYEDPEWRVPHPGICLPVLLIVEKAVCAAWALLRSKPRTGFDLQTADEDAITLELHEALYDRVFKEEIVAGFDADVFATVEREPKIRSYDYGHPDKMPDLLVRLVGRPSGIRNTQDGLFIECKPVDKNHGVKSHYCQKGLVRFIDGEYAWAMTTAMMVGYTKSGYGISTHLAKGLADWSQGAGCALQACPHSTASTINEAVHSTLHVRSFIYVETKQRAPKITIRHLWLKR